MTLAVLVEARAAHGDTQAAAAARLGVCRQTFGQYELGHQLPPIRLWAPLAAYCGVEVADLAGDLAALHLGWADP